MIFLHFSRNYAGLYFSQSVLSVRISQIRRTMRHISQLLLIKAAAALEIFIVLFSSSLLWTRFQPRSARTSHNDIQLKSALFIVSLRPNLRNHLLWKNSLKAIEIEPPVYRRWIECVPKMRCASKQARTLNGTEVGRMQRASDSTTKTLW